MVDPESHQDREAPPHRGGRSSATGNAATKAMTILEAAVSGGEPRRLAEIAAKTEVSRASVHRILRTLVGLGFVSGDGTGVYRPGPRIRVLAAEIQAGYNTGIAEELDRLAGTVGHTVHMALRSGDHAVYSHKVEGDQPFQMASRIGMSIPLHCTGIGKCILAHLPAEELRGIVDSAGLPTRTSATITDPRSLADELESVRRNGFAVDDEENERTVRCIAAPVLDRGGVPVGGISISTVTFLTPRDTIVSFAPALFVAAETISKLIG